MDQNKKPNEKYTYSTGMLMRDLRDLGGLLLTNRITQAIVVAALVYLFCTGWNELSRPDATANDHLKHELKTALDNQNRMGHQLDSLHQLTQDYEQELRRQIQRADSLQAVNDSCCGAQPAVQPVIKKKTSPVPKKQPIVKKKTKTVPGTTRRPRPTKPDTVRRQPTTQPTVTPPVADTVQAAKDTITVIITKKRKIYYY